MNTRYLYLIVLGLIVLGTNIFAQESIQSSGLTFDSALEIAFRNNPAIKQSSYLKQEKTQLRKASKGLYLPSIGLSANYAIMQKDLGLDLTPVKDAITPLYSSLSSFGYFSGVPNPDPVTAPTMPILPDNISTQVIRGKLKEGLSEVNNADWNPIIQKKQFGVISADFTWPLYAGGKIHSANSAARIEMNEADEAGRLKENELIGEVVERYFGLCLAKSAVQVRQEVYNGMQKHLYDAQKMQNEGIISKADALHAQLFQSQAERELLKARRQEDIANKALYNSMFIDNTVSINLLDRLFYLDSLEPQDYFINSAKANNPLLAQIDSKKQLAAINKRVQLAAYLPEIAAIGTYNIANQDLSPYTPEWMVGIGLKWNIFDGASSYRKIKAADLKCLQVEETDNKANADITLAIKKLYEELGMYKEQLQALETSLAFAEEYLRVSERSFKEEMSNETQVVDARMALAQVRIDRLQAMYGYDICLVKLLQFSGITEKFSQYYHSSTAKN